MRTLLLTAALLLPLPIAAQFITPAAVDNFKDKSILKPPAGSKVAVIVFEDLGCPSCAKAHPIELQAIEQTHVPLIRYDFPFPQHVWTFEGAVCARYIQDHINPKLATDFRGDVFAKQTMFATPPDIDRYFRDWLTKHGQHPPMVIDPNGQLAHEVGADLALATKLNVEYTPTIVVVTKDKYQVVFGTKPQPGANDATRLLPVIQAAQAATAKSR